MTTTVETEYAGPVSRMIAYGLDAAIVSVLFTGATVALSMMASFIGAEAQRLALAATSAYLVVLPAMLAIYCAVFWQLAGRTPGMAVLGLRVVAVRARPVSWLSILVRALVLAYFPIGSLWALVDRRRQAVHDKLARTTVIRALQAPRG
jgi:uncharacterized RDD family membrane protein YckC